MAAREIPGLATVLERIDGAMAPAAAWCERRGVSHMYELKELGDDGEIEEFCISAGLKDFQKKLVKKRILELTRPPLPETVGAAPPAPSPTTKAVQLSGGGKPYLMRMVGTLYPVGISPSAPPAALEAAARDRLRALLRAGSGKSGGTDVLSGYGSARVDGM